MIINIMVDTELAREGSKLSLVKHSRPDHYSYSETPWLAACDAISHLGERLMDSEPGELSEVKLSTYDGDIIIGNVWIK